MRTLTIGHEHHPIRPHSPTGQGFRQGQVFVFKVGDGAHLNTIQLGAHGRYRTNVWNYAGINILRPGGMDELRMHPTVKPVALVADALTWPTA
jgi:hypothetical protein